MMTPARCPKCGRRCAIGERWVIVVVTTHGGAMRQGETIEGHVECVVDDVAALLVAPASPPTPAPAPAPYTIEGHGPPTMHHVAGAFLQGDESGKATTWCKLSSERVRTAWSGPSTVARVGMFTPPLELELERGELAYATTNPLDVTCKQCLELGPEGERRKSGAPVPPDGGVPVRSVPLLEGRGASIVARLPVAPGRSVVVPFRRRSDGTPEGGCAWCGATRAGDSHLCAECLGRNAPPS